MRDFQRSPKKSLPLFIHSPLSISSATTAGCPSGYHSEVSARSLGDDTKQSVSVCGDLKETLIPAERGGSAQRAAEWERDGFNDAENWPVTVVHPSGKSLLQLAVNLSVPLSSHPAPPTPQRRLAQSTPHLSPRTHHSP